MKKGKLKTNTSKPKLFLFANILVVVLLLILPIYLFSGRLFLGGDDTRFYLSYPKLFLDSLSLYSWNNISSLPYYIPNHYWIPFVFIVSQVENLIGSKILISYVLFSSVLILGFIYFQKFIRQLIGDVQDISFLTALFYIASPITLVSVAFFLSPVYLISLVPIVAYYFVRYLKEEKISDLMYATIWSIIFSFVYYSIPWIIGLFLPFIIGALFYFIFVDRKVIVFLKRILIFSFFIASSQLFWLVPFFASLVSGGSTGLGQKAVSQSLVVSFKNTVISTANDNILYPLLNLYHRKIVFDFEWHLKDLFLNYYDYILPLGVIFVFTLFLGVLKYNQALDKDKRKLFILFFVSFLIVLYFCTVNIGFLKDAFVLFVYIPGFAILRNFTDKFALAFVFIYTIVLSFSFLVIKKTYRSYKIIYVISLLAIFVGFAPVKQIISAPLWKTNNVYTTVKFPQEYRDFVKDVKDKVPNTTNVFALPQNITSYEIITEENGVNTYVGTSPFKFFTGINDLTGVDSYPSNISADVQKLIINRDYKNLLSLLMQINSGYLMVTNNVPVEIKRSYLFDRNYLRYQDQALINSITEKKIIESKNGNFVIYKLRNNPRIFSTKADIAYKKINSITYELDIKNLNKLQNLTFLETYHPRWVFYPICQNKRSNVLWDSLIGRTVLDSSHTAVVPYGNKWVISPDLIKKEIDANCFVQNKNGSISIKLLLFFSPQKYFYLGVIMTVLLLGGGFIILNKTNGKKRKK